MNTFSIISLLVLGFGLGLKHATEADHLAAVSTIVSERKSIWSSALVGGLWGVGHTISLFVAGIAVILFHFEISERDNNFRCRLDRRHDADEHVDRPTTSLYGQPVHAA